MKQSIEDIVEAMTERIEIAYLKVIIKKRIKRLEEASEVSSEVH